MRLVLINPPHPYLVNPNAQVSLGLAYISASVKTYRPAVDVRLVNYSALTVEQAAAQAPDADVYGYTGTCLDFANVVRLSKLIRRRFPESLHILGGPHATTMSETITEFDSVFVGEGEYSILNFVDDFQHHTVKSVYRWPRIEELDELPFPDRQAYGIEQGGKVMIKQYGPSTVISSSRGCNFACAFCASNAVWGVGVRKRSVASVVDEIREVILEHDVRVFRFSDEDLTADKDWLMRLCRAVKGLKIRWRASARVDRIDAETAAAMVDAGCTDFSVGVESFDPQVLRVLNKRITPQQSIDAVNAIHAAGGNPRLLMMVGTPGESLQTVDLNIAGLEDLRGQYGLVSLTTFMPLPGTRIWNHPEKYGVSITDRDFTQYQLYMYERRDGAVEQTEPRTPIRIDGMSLEQQHENICRMRAYIASLPEHNRGV